MVVNDDLGACEVENGFDVREDALKISRTAVRAGVVLNMVVVVYVIGRG